MTALFQNDNKTHFFCHNSLLLSAFPITEKCLFIWKKWKNKLKAMNLL